MTGSLSEPLMQTPHRPSPKKPGLWALTRRLWDRTAIYMPLVTMSLLALGTYWLVRNTPMFNAPPAQAPISHEVDYFMHQFTVKTFDENGKLKSQISGLEARHFPDTDILEIDQVKIRSVALDGQITTATAVRAYTNSDGSEVQLTGNARVMREASKSASGKNNPRLEFRGEFLHVFFNEERVTSHKPVLLIRGADQFTGDTFSYSSIDQVALLNGRVKGVLMPKQPAGKRP